MPVPVGDRSRPPPPGRVAGRARLRLTTPQIDTTGAGMTDPHPGGEQPMTSETIDLPDDDVVRRCVLSVQLEIHAVMPNYMAKKRRPQNLSDPMVLDDLADHIARFSIAGVRAMIGLESEGRPAAGPSPSEREAMLGE